MKNLNIIKNLNLEMVKKSRTTINDSRELELYDYSMYSNCEEVVKCLRQQVVEYRGGVGSEYKELKSKYKKVKEEFKPIMKMCYKGYKAYCIKNGLSYSICFDL